MKVLIILIFLCCATLSAGEWRPTAQLLQAIREIESSNGQFVYGDRGASLGDFQMSKGAWSDVSEWRKSRNLKTYDYKQKVLNPKINELYAADYLSINYRQLCKELRRPPSAGELYAAYNMGMSKFEECGFDLRRVNRLTAERCEMITAMTRPAKTYRITTYASAF